MEERSSAEDEADYKEDADTDFSQPHVTITSAVPEVERRATTTTTELVEQPEERQLHFSDTGEGVCEAWRSHSGGGSQWIRRCS